MYDIEINDINVNFLFKGTPQEAATLRKNLMTNIYNYAIDKIIYYENTSGTNPEKLALRFGLLIIDQNFTNEVGKLDVTGPKMIMSDDIQGIKTIYNMPIIYLDDKEVLKCDFILAKNCGKEHQKYNPVSAVTFIKQDNDFKFSLELTGVLTFDQICAQL